MPLLETTAGQGTNLGYCFEHLRDIIGMSKYPDRFGVCLDTCHVFAAGYDMRTEADCAATFNQFDDVIGLERLKAFHLNDAKSEYQSPRGSARTHWRGEYRHNRIYVYPQRLPIC